MTDMFYLIVWVFAGMGVLLFASWLGMTFLALLDGSGPGVGIVKGKAGKRPPRKLVGQAGITVTQLSPSGFVMIDRQRHPATSLGEFIESDCPVDIIDRRGTNLIVKSTTDDSHK